MHVNGYTSDATPIVVPIDPEPMVDTFTVEVAREQATAHLEVRANVRVNYPATP